MAGTILNGKQLAQTRMAQVQTESHQFYQQHGRQPRLTVIMAGDDPASAIYVRGKSKACEKTGILSEVLSFPATVESQNLRETIGALNLQPDIDAILVQLPLPAHVDPYEILDCITPSKDVDAFTSANIGHLWRGGAEIVPCTPRGIMRLLDEYHIPIEGRRAVVAGRSLIVGKPMAALLLERHATVTLAHSRTVNLESVCKQADILVAAIGKPAFFTRSHIKEGAVVIDVGINRVPVDQADSSWIADTTNGSQSKPPKEYVIVGDVHPQDMAESSSFYTPVPGGVGAMTVVELLHNTLILARRRMHSQK